MSRKCDDCGRKARVKVVALRVGELRIGIEPPQLCCRGCFSRLWLESQANGFELERVSIAVPPNRVPAAAPIAETEPQTAA